MSATFYPAKQESEKGWTFVEVPYEVNLSNSNTRFVLEALGLDSNFEDARISQSRAIIDDANAKEQDIDDFIERCHVVLRGGAQNILHEPPYEERVPWHSSPQYILHKVAMLLVSATLGKQNGATHWYFA